MSGFKTKLNDIKGKTERLVQHATQHHHNNKEGAAAAPSPWLGTPPPATATTSSSAAAATTSNGALQVYELSLEEDGSPSTEKSYVRLPAPTEPYLLRFTIEAGGSACKNGSLFTNHPPRAKSSSGPRTTSTGCRPTSASRSSSTCSSRARASLSSTSSTRPSSKRPLTRRPTSPSTASRRTPSACAASSVTSTSTRC